MPKISPNAPEENKEIKISESSVQSSQLGQAGRDIIQIRDSVVKIYKKPVGIATSFLLLIVGACGIFFAVKHNSNTSIVQVNGSGANVVNSKNTPLVLESLLVSKLGEHYIIEAAVHNLSSRDTLGNKIFIEIEYFNSRIACHLVGYTKYSLSQAISLKTKLGSKMEFDAETLRQVQGLPKHTITARGIFQTGCASFKTIIEFDTSQVFFKEAYTILHIQVPKNFKIIEDHSVNQRKSLTKKESGSSFVLPFEVEKKDSDFYPERKVTFSIRTNSQGEISLTDNSRL